MRVFSFNNIGRWSLVALLLSAALVNLRIPGVGITIAAVATALIPLALLIALILAYRENAFAGTSSLVKWAFAAGAAFVGWAFLSGLWGGVDKQYLQNGLVYLTYLLAVVVAYAWQRQTGGGAKLLQWLMPVATIICGGLMWVVVFTYQGERTNNYIEERGAAMLALMFLCYFLAKARAESKLNWLWVAALVVTIGFTKSRLCYLTSFLLCLLAVLPSNLQLKRLFPKVARSALAGLVVTVLFAGFLFAYPPLKYRFGIQYDPVVAAQQYAEALAKPDPQPDPQPEPQPADTLLADAQQTGTEPVAEPEPIPTPIEKEKPPVEIPDTVVADTVVAAVPEGDKLSKDSLLLDVSNADIYSSGRNTLWEITWGSYKESPIIGKGMASAMRLITSYYGENYIYGSINHPHNDYLRLLHDLGMPGLFLFVCFALLLTLGYVKKLFTSSSSPGSTTIELTAPFVLLATAFAMVTDNLIVYSFVMGPVGLFFGLATGTVKPVTGKEVNNTTQTLQP
jgi:O-Antigen ligase